MKALSIRQPWAELILQGRKTIELRTWSTNYRGRIAIHAAQKLEEDACEAYGLNPDELVRGALVGTVEILDIITFNDGSYDGLRNEHLDLGNRPGDVLGWKLANPERLDNPVPMRGRLNLFEVPDDLAKQAGLPDDDPTTGRAPTEPPDPTKPFELHVEPRGTHTYALALYQWAVMANGVTPSAQRVVVLSGDALRAVADHVLEALRRAGYKATDLSPRRRVPFRLDEETGLRLGLLFLAIAPLSRLDRVETISHELRSMPSEEAYYWYSKCTTTDIGTRARRALRVLLAAE